MDAKSSISLHRKPEISREAMTALGNRADADLSPRSPIEGGDGRSLSHPSPSDFGETRTAKEQGNAEVASGSC